MYLKYKYLFELPSSISWCESKYVFTPYIAEFFNTVTGFTFCISAILQFKYHRDNILFRSQFYTFIVGIGTMMFHSTLLYHWQLLDEIPMILIAIEYINIFCSINKSIFYYPIYLITLVYFINPNYQVILFQTVFASYVLIIIYNVTFKLKNITDNYNLKKTIIIFVISLILWKIEQYYCKNIIKFFQLHAIWHILTSIGLFYFNKVIYSTLN
jgi:dihydroceramidase